MKWPEQFCPNCRKPLHRRRVYCVECQLVLQDRIVQEAEEMAQHKTQRAQHQQQAFMSAFDQRAFELALSKLKSSEQVTVTSLILLLDAEGFFEKYRATAPSEIKHIQYDTWARKRVLGLAKWWAKHEVAFIRAQVAQGHPYLFYLGKKPDAVFDLSMPKKSIAQRSVNKVIRSLESVHHEAETDEVSG